MNTCDVLIVEDDEHTIEGWARDIREFNRGAGKKAKFSPTFARNRDEALRLLSRQRFDCAVVDLRLPAGAGGGGESEPHGNDVLHGLLLELGIPAYVYSAYEGEVSDEVRASNIKIARKEGGATSKILDSFERQADLMEAMGQMRRQVAQETSRFFNRSIWPRWEKRWAEVEDRRTIAGIISRQTIAHVAEALSQPPASHHPDEFYIVPSLYPDRLETGDIVRHGDETLIVLTPRCNLANKTPSKILLALCSPCPAWQRWKSDLAGSAKAKEKAEQEVRSHSTQGHAIATHFLPPLEDVGPWLVDFRELRTVDVDKVGELLSQRMASVAPQFVANLVQRHSAYIGRIGQPEIDASLLVVLCKGLASDPSAAK